MFLLYCLRHANPSFLYCFRFLFLLSMTCKSLFSVLHSMFPSLLSTTCKSLFSVLCCTFPFNCLWLANPTFLYCASCIVFNCLCHANPSFLYCASCLLFYCLWHAKPSFLHCASWLLLFLWQECHQRQSSTRWSPWDEPTQEVTETLMLDPCGQKQDSYFISSTSHSMLY